MGCDKHVIYSSILLLALLFPHYPTASPKLLQSHSTPDKARPLPSPPEVVVSINRRGGAGSHGGGHAAHAGGGHGGSTGMHGSIDDELCDRNFKRAEGIIVIMRPTPFLHLSPNYSHSPN
ncbi:hypothetical protein L6164_018935 [Bauhinia variegata]|uniref:Uncharacterized protein n=1 Tax=Bauhinia variegata TaxID=167791 RepID=A0ACB9NET0_BAUVA|nr:hypothetical protein L6164_018935 [Bauhinia variegata]